MRINSIISIFVLFFVTFNTHAATYYVSISGNDANPGTEFFPWSTIQQAANTLVAGDTVLIKEGVYNERVIAENSGTIDNYIVYSKYENDNVTIDGSGISWGGAWNGLFDLSDKNYIQLNGLKIMNADYGGIWLENSDNITIKNNHIYNTFSSGIAVWNSSNIILKNNEVELACNNGEQECITIANSAYCQVFKNHVHHNGPGTNGGEGIDVKQGSHDVNIYQNVVHHLNERIGIYADAWDTHTYNINISQNIVHNCGNNGIVVQSEMGGLIEYVNFYNNIVYSNKWDGISVGSVTAEDTVSSTPVKHIQIINNTLYKNGEILDGWGYGILIDNPDAEDIIIRNNISSKNSAQMAITHIGTGGIVDHNLCYGNNIAEGTLYGTDSIIGDPLFIDTLLNNFYLQYTSPAIDNGTAISAPEVDFDSLTRPYGTGYDIGAYEFTPYLNIQSEIISDRIIELFPNPFLDQLTVIINADDFENYTLKIFTVNGELVQELSHEKPKDNRIIINGKELESGLYILTVSFDNGLNISEKLILE